MTVHSASVTLPFLPAARQTGTIQGDPGVALEKFLGHTITLTPEAIAEAESADFATPKAATTSGGKPPKKPKPPKRG